MRTIYLIQRPILSTLKVPPNDRSGFADAFIVGWIVIYVLTLFFSHVRKGLDCHSIFDTFCLSGPKGLKLSIFGGRG